MTDSKHTPGPWHVGHLGSDSKCQCAYVFSSGYAGGICQVQVDNGRAISDGGNDAPPKDQAVANMHLIAAAPEMFEALKALDEVGVINPAGHKALDAAVVKMRAAIAKAETQP